MIRQLKLSGAIFATILFAFSVGISIMVLTWIDKLEKTACKCSEDFKRDYIKYYYYAYLTINTLMYLNAMYVIYTGNVGLNNSFLLLIIHIVQYILPVVSLINMIFAIMYIWKLKETDCKCSEDIRREIYYILNWINVGFISLTVVMVLLSAIVWAAVFGMAFGRSMSGVNYSSGSSGSSGMNSRSFSKSK